MGGKRQLELLSSKQNWSQMWEVPEVTCELPPPIPGPGLPARHFKLPPGTALAIDFGSMMAQSTLLLGLLALWAQLQAAPIAEFHGEAPAGWPPPGQPRSALLDKSHVPGEEASVVPDPQPGKVISCGKQELCTEQMGKDQLLHGSVPAAAANPALGKLDTGKKPSSGEKTSCGGKTEPQEKPEVVAKPETEGNPAPGEKAVLGEKPEIGAKPESEGEPGAGKEPGSSQGDSEKDDVNAKDDGDDNADDGDSDGDNDSDNDGDDDGDKNKLHDGNDNEDSDNNSDDDSDEDVDGDNSNSTENGDSNSNETDDSNSDENGDGGNNDSYNDDDDDDDDGDESVDGDNSNSNENSDSNSSENSDSNSDENGADSRAMMMMVIMVMVLVTAIALVDKLQGMQGTEKPGYCYHISNVQDTPDESCGPCRMDTSCSRCSRDADCPGVTKCCPSKCGYTCQEPVLDFCYLPSVCGNCKALFRRFFFNASSQQCEEFIYGGCGGNRNNFETKGECSQACSHLGN
ncbi:hypothetical protein WISP_90844 [Willisornis vidua]|uniref:Uncharacterized protein n=2 Tax=Thamnophilidae TaxID=81887 RepID=A0ABQ9D603_9PASS|nr:hypothetical protein WISP_90844 [Willisornis vidua]